MKKVYKGSCHCGFVKFDICADIDHVRQCNCSICSKRGTLNFRVNENAINIETPLKDMVLYQWGSKTAKDYFCPKCGILSFRKPSSPTPAELAQGVKPFKGWAINVKCLEGLNISELPIVKIDGAAL